MVYSGVLVHFSGGLIEVHFHVLVSMAFLILCYDWLAQVVAAVAIAIHHIVLDEVLPGAVFKAGQWLNDPRPPCDFVLAMTAVCVFIAECIRRSAVSVQAALRSMADRDAKALELGLAALATGDLTMQVQVSTQQSNVQSIAQSSARLLPRQTVRCPRSAAPSRTTKTPAPIWRAWWTTSALTAETVARASAHQEEASTHAASAVSEVVSARQAPRLPGASQTEGRRPPPREV